MLIYCLQIAISWSCIKNNNINVYETTTGNQLIIENQTIKNTFKYPGAYTASVIPIDLANQPKRIETQEFLFDNAQPQPPVVDAIISGEFLVETQYGEDEVIIKEFFEKEMRPRMHAK